MKNVRAVHALLYPHKMVTAAFMFLLLVAMGLITGDLIELTIVGIVVAILVMALPPIKK